MRSKHVETYQLGSTWTAVSTDYGAGWLRTGTTETEALANLCDALIDDLEGKPEAEEWEP